MMHTAQVNFLLIRKIAMSLLRSLPMSRGYLAARYSPWLVIDITAILGFVIAILAFQNAQREKASMAQNLTDKANALIWAEVYRTFSPLPRFHRHTWLGSSVDEDCRECSWGADKITEQGPSSSSPNNAEDSLLIFVGLDVKPFEDALAGLSLEGAEK